MPGYDSFSVGIQITIPNPVSPTIAPVPFDPCGQGSGWTWHCTDPMGTDEFGRQVFLSCEQEPPAQFATTVPPSTAAFPDSTVQVFDSSTTTGLINTIPPFESTSTTNVGTLPVDGASTTTSTIESPTTTQFP